MTSAANAKPTNSTRKPLDAQFVGETNAAAIKALGDNAARRKWPDSKHGSPLTTNILCAEIARLNIAQEVMVHALQLTERLINEALPKFDWGKSALDANAIALLNEVPIDVRKALASVRPLPSADHRSA